jgi:hypothetical protein
LRQPLEAVGFARAGQGELSFGCKKIDQIGDEGETISLEYLVSALMTQGNRLVLLKGLMQRGDAVGEAHYRSGRGPD